MASAMAPQLTAMSATLNVGHRSEPMPTSRKSTTPRALRTRSMRLPAAPPATRPRAKLAEAIAGRTAARHAREHDHGEQGHREEDPSRVWADMQAERGALVIHQAQLEPVADDRDARRTEQCGLRENLGEQVGDDRRERRRQVNPTLGAGDPRSATLSIFLFLLAGDAQARVRQRVEALGVYHVQGERGRSNADLGSSGAERRVYLTAAIATVVPISSPR